jgi:hypothetical protein
VMVVVVVVMVVVVVASATCAAAAPPARQFALPSFFLPSARPPALPKATQVVKSSVRLSHTVAI